MSFEFSERVQRVEPSATLAISNKASELAAEGADVVDLSVGEPDFDTPESIKAAGKRAIDEGHTGYTPSNGVPELRQAIADRLAEDGLDYGPENVVVTPGGKQALFEVVQTLVDGVDGQSPSASGTSSRAGDEVVLLDPAWVSYEAMGKLAGGQLTRLDLSVHDFQLEPALEDLEKVLTDDTELLIVNSPSNPTGAVYSRTALEGLRDLAVEHDVTVISDEIYGEVTYDVDPTSVAALDGMAERTVTVSGFSKSYAMTGWRLGYFAAHEELVAQAGKVHSHSVSCAANFVQHAGVAALREVDEEIDEMVAAFRERRDLLVDLLAEEGVEVQVPHGAFYLMLPVEGNDQRWCEQVIGEAHVATVPGSAFGAPGYARISYANSQERIREAVQRLADGGFL
ncbi:aspartate aminotransferase [Halobacteriales archaeon QS_1_68_20]|nr:MAG: aspartate aminotransferase [Halobacteriales archaeon QS_1_68_20]